MLVETFISLCEGGRGDPPHKVCGERRTHQSYGGDDEDAFGLLYN